MGKYRIYCSLLILLHIVHTPRYNYAGFFCIVLLGLANKEKNISPTIELDSFPVALGRLRGPSTSTCTGHMLKGLH